MVKECWLGGRERKVKRVGVRHACGGFEVSNERRERGWNIYAEMKRMKSVVDIKTNNGNVKNCDTTKGLQKLHPHAPTVQLHSTNSQPRAHSWGAARTCKTLRGPNDLVSPVAQ